MSESKDSHDQNNNIPLLAQRLFDSYDYDALPLLIENCSRVIGSLRTLYPNLPENQLDKARKIITLEALVKFTHLAENLAAFDIAFKQRYQTEKEEILGIFKTIAKYDVGQVIDFYKHIQNRNLQYVAHFIGYPSLSIQPAYTKQFVEMSCQNIKTDMIEIAEIYDTQRPLYDAYKHGYRIAFATDAKTGVDVFTFIDKDNEEYYIPVSKDYFDRIQQLARSCLVLFQLIFSLHKERIKYENGGSVQNAEIKIHLYPKPNDLKPNEEDLEFIYPSRGEMLDQLRAEGNRIYSEIINEEFERKNPGKIVAIDTDEKTIIALDYELEKVIQTIHERNLTGRIFIRRVGKDEKLAVEVY